MAASSTAPAPPARVPQGASVVLYDGVCALCNGTVRFTLKWDRGKHFFFAPLQSAFAREALARYGADPSDLDTMYVLARCGEPSERLLAKSEGVFYILETLGGIWSVARIASWLPKPLLDRAYDLVARFRYRWFGKYDSCPIPEPAVRERFIDVA